MADISTRFPLDAGWVCWANWGEYSSENQSTTWGVKLACCMASSNRSADEASEYSVTYWAPALCMACTLVA